jgi:hypothetical protein
MIVTSIQATPQDAEAYIFSKTSYRFEQITNLQNGYRVGVSGLGTMNTSLIGVYVATNSGVQVLNTKNSKSKLKSVKISYVTTGFFVVGTTLGTMFRKLHDEISATCGDIGYSVCTVNGSKSIPGGVAVPSAHLRVDVVFNDGSYTIYPNRTSSIVATGR